MVRSPKTKRGGGSTSFPALGFGIGSRPRQQLPLLYRFSNRVDPDNSNLTGEDQEEEQDHGWHKPSLLDRIRPATPPLLSRIEPPSPEQSLAANGYTDEEQSNSTDSPEDPAARSDDLQKQAEQFLEQFQHQSLEFTAQSGDKGSRSSAPRNLVRSNLSEHKKSPGSLCSERQSLSRYRPSPTQNIPDWSPKEPNNVGIGSSVGGNEDEGDITDSEETLVVTMLDAPQTKSSSEPDTSISSTNAISDVENLRSPMVVDIAIDNFSPYGLGRSQPRLSGPEAVHGDGIQRDTIMKQQALHHVEESVCQGGGPGVCAPGPNPTTDHTAGETLVISGTSQKRQIHEVPGKTISDKQRKVNYSNGSPQPGAVAAVKASYSRAELVSGTRPSLLSPFDPIISTQHSRSGDSTVASCLQKEHISHSPKLLSTPPLEDLDRSIEQCRKILIPVVLQNLNSRRGSGSMFSDKQTMEPVVASLLTDARCVEFVQLSQRLQTKLVKGGKRLRQWSSAEDDKREFINAVRAGIKRPRNESEEERRFRSKRNSAVAFASLDDSVIDKFDVLDTNHVQEASSDPSTTLGASTTLVDSFIENSPTVPRLSLDDSGVHPTESLVAACGNDSIGEATLHSRESTHNNRSDPTTTSSPRTNPLGTAAPDSRGNSASAQLPFISSDLSSRSTPSVPPQTPVDNGQTNHELEEGEVPMNDDFVSEENAVFENSFVGSLTDRYARDYEKDGYMSEKRRGKQRAVEESFEEGEIEEVRFNDRGDEHLLSEGSQQEAEQRAIHLSIVPSPESQSLSLGAVPGILFVRVGEPCSDVLQASFVVDKDMEEGVERWCRGHHPKTSQKQISLHVQCILKANAVEVNQRLEEEEDSSEDGVTRALWEIPCHWPRAGQILVQVNVEQVSESGRTWFSHEIIQGKAIDISSSIRSGVNTVHLIQLGDLSDYVFVLHALRHPIPPTESKVDSI